MIENHSRRESHTHTHTLYSSNSFYILIQFHPPSDFCYLYLNFFLRPPHLTTNFCNEFSVIFFFLLYIDQGLPIPPSPVQTKKSSRFLFLCFFFLNTLLYLRFTLPPVLSQNKTKRSTNISEPTTQ